MKHKKINMMAELKKAVTTSGPFKQARRGKGSRCLFRVEDVFKTPNMLSRLVRGIVIKENITVVQLEDALREGIIRAGRKTKDLHSDKMNLVSAVSREAVSFNKAFELLSTVLGYDMSITIHLTKDGVTRNYNFEQVCDEMRQLEGKLKG